MFNSESVNVFNFNSVSKICLLIFFTLPHFIAATVVGTSEYRAFNCYKKTTLKVSALTKSCRLRLGWPTGPHVVIPVPVEGSVPITQFPCWSYSTGTTIDSMAVMLFEMPRNVPATQVKELFGRALILILLVLLFGFILSSWCITLVEHTRAFTCQMHRSTHMLKMHKKVTFHISVEKLGGSETKWPFPPLCHLLNVLN